MCAYGTGRKPRGAALIIAMLVMAVLLLAGTTFLTISSTETQIALNERVSAQAFMVAEAGLHKAIQQLDANSGYSGETGTAFGGGTFSVAVTTVAGCTATSARSLTVTGVVPVRGGQAQSQIQAIVDQISYPFRWAAFAALPSGGTSPQLHFTQNSTTDSFDSSVGPYNATTNIGSFGNVGANINVTLDNGTHVSGAAAAAGTLTNNGTIDGSRLTGVPILSFPSPSAPSAPTGDLEVNNGQTVTYTPGTYVYHDVTFENNAVLAYGVGVSSTTPIVIYVTGDFKTKNNVLLGANPGTSLQFILTGTFTNENQLGNNVRIYASVYGPNTDITLGNTTYVYGSIIVRTFNSGNTSAVHYDEAMFDQQLCTNGKFNIRRGTWYEVLP